jgi:hypothetical protein
MIRSFLARSLALFTLAIVLGLNAEAFAQSIKVLSPNGGETWEAGTTHSVTWQSSGINDELEVQFSTDGSQWRRIARVNSGTTQLSWTVDNRPSEVAQIRVINKDETVSDISDGVFTITPDPLDRLLMISPNGGETLTSGEVYMIRWQAPLDAIDVQLDYSTNFGVNWTPITTTAASLGQHPWIVPNVGDKPVTTALVRVMMPEDVEEFDASDAAFTIAPKVVVIPARLAVAYPNGGETLEAGETVNVTWSYTAASNDEGENEGPELMVQYSTNGGSSWNEIATEDAEGGSHNWVVSNVTTTTALVRVIEIGGALADTSDAMFSINGVIASPNNLAVTVPNGGEVWKEGEMHEITWNAQGELGEAKIYLETTGARDHITKTQLAAIAANAGKLAWAVPDLGDEPLQARIIVEADGLQDVSDAPFTILPAGSLSVRTNTKDMFTLRGLYPNPAHDLITFTWTPNGKSAVIAKLYNSTGAVVRTTSVSSNSSELSMHVNDLPQGAYFYELIADGHISRGALTIRR